MTHLPPTLKNTGPYTVRSGLSKFQALRSHRTGKKIRRSSLPFFLSGSCQIYRLTLGAMRSFCKDRIYSPIRYYPVGSSAFSSGKCTLSSHLKNYFCYIAVRAVTASLSGWCPSLFFGRIKIRMGNVSKSLVVVVLWHCSDFFPFSQRFRSDLKPDLRSVLFRLGRKQCRSVAAQISYYRQIQITASCLNTKNARCPLPLGGLLPKAGPATWGNDETAAPTPCIFCTYEL